MERRYFTWLLSIGGAILLVLLATFWPLCRILTVADQLPRLKADDETSRREAIGWLRAVGELDTTALPALIDMLGAPAKETSDWEDEPEQFQPAGDGDSRNAAAALTQIGGPAVDPLIIAMAQGDELVRARAIWVLGSIYADRPAQRWAGVQLLIDHLKDPSPLVRRSAAASTVGKLKSPRFLELLAAALDDPDEKVRTQAAYALGELGLEKAAPCLAALFEKPDWQFSDMPEKSIAKLRGPRTKELLERYLQSPSPRLRKRAAIAFREMADPATLGTLVDVLGDPNGAVRAEVARAIGRLGQPAAPRLAELLRSPDRTIRDAAEMAFSHMEFRESVPAELLGALKDPDEDVRCRAARSLGATSGEGAAAGLCSALGDASVPVRRCVVQALCNLSIDSSAAAVAKRLKDPDREVREIAAETLRYAHSAEAAGLLADMLAESDREVQLHALRSLAHQESPGLAGRLRPFLRDPDPVFREAAAWSLACLKDREAAADVSALLKDVDPRVRRTAVRSLGELASPAGAPGLAALALAKNEDLGLRTEAMRALASIRGPEAARALVKALADETPLVRQVAADQLGAVGRPETVEPLIAALEDPRTRALARESLQQVVWRDFGDAPAGWLRWWRGRGQAGFQAAQDEPEPGPAANAEPEADPGESPSLLFGSSPDSPGLLRRLFGGRPQQSDDMEPVP